MLRKLIVLAAVGLLPVIAQAHFKQGDWDLTLGGSGYHGPDLDGVSAGVGIGLGYLVTDNLEAGLRQSVNFDDFGAGSDLDGVTSVFADYHFSMGDRGQWRPFVGANVGFAWGQGSADSFQFGPEAGVKYFLNETTYVGLSIAYEMYCNNPAGGSTLSNGEFLYGLQLGVRL